MEQSSRTLKLKAFLRKRASSMSSLLSTHLSKMILWKEQNFDGYGKDHAFEEYKTLDRFWAKAINTACYAINRLYLHRILKKTSYELLTGKSPMFLTFEFLGANVLFL
jgi:hypothetical protein